jgi:NAD(P)-dependent dehydrogenase (short-subunit alcohol dehydrogenase family)
VPFAAFDLTGKTALVTGGNRGIGFGMAQGLAQAGARLVIWGTNPEITGPAAEALRTEGQDVLAPSVDVTDQARIAEAMAEAVDWSGGCIDTVIASAVAPPVLAPLTDFADEDYRRLMAVNLDGFVWTMKHACRHIVARAKAGRPGASLIGLGSLAGSQGAARNSVYAAAKGAIPALMNSLATEYARFGVRANTVVPGWIATDRTAERRADPAYGERVLPRIPARRWGEAEDFAGVAVYLASDASAYHTGDTLVIDGGYQVF